jgi:phage recombination protein Bet
MNMAGNNQQRSGGVNRGGGRQVAQRDAPEPLVKAHRPEKKSILDKMAARFDMDPMGLQRTLIATVFKDCSNEEFAALLVVAEAYNLNPLTKEIYAFKAQGGGIVPLVSIDGWIRIINEHPQFAGIEWEDMEDAEGNLFAIACTIHRKDRENHPVRVIEYLEECRRNTDPWKTMPARMLRHKATIQCARYAFGFSGIADDNDFIDGGELSTAPIPPMRQQLLDGDQRNMRDVTPRNGDGQATGEKADPGTGEIFERDESQEEAGPTPPTHPAWSRAKQIDEDLKLIEVIADLTTLRANTLADIEAMPADVADAVNAAIDAKEAALKAPK